MNKLEIFNKQVYSLRDKSRIKDNLPDIRPGDFIKVHQKIKEGNKDRIQIFEGQVLARKHGKSIGATITVRKMIGNIGVERILPVHLPSIEEIEITKRGKVRRAKLYYLRTAKGKKSRLKVKTNLDSKENIDADGNPAKQKESLNQ